MERNKSEFCKCRVINQTCGITFHVTHYDIVRNAKETLGEIETIDSADKQDAEGPTAVL